RFLYDLFSSLAAAPARSRSPLELSAAADRARAGKGEDFRADRCGSAPPFSRWRVRLQRFFPRRTSGWVDREGAVQFAAIATTADTFQKTYGQGRPGQWCHRETRHNRAYSG